MPSASTAQGSNTKGNNTSKYIHPYSSYGTREKNQKKEKEKEIGHHARRRRASATAPLRTATDMDSASVCIQRSGVVGGLLRGTKRSSGVVKVLYGYGQ